MFVASVHYEEGVEMSTLFLHIFTLAKIAGRTRLVLLSGPAIEVAHRPLSSGASSMTTRYIKT
jgi:hypothetical protein